MSNDGKVFILVLESKDIHGHRWYRSTANAYAKVYMDNKKTFKTQVVDKTTEPKWEEKAVIWELAGASELKISMKDSGIVTDKTVGEVTFKVSDLMDGVPRDEWYPLSHKHSKKDSGQVHLQIMYLEPGDAMTSSYSEFPHPLQTLLRKKKFKGFQNALNKKEFLENQDDQGGNRPLHVACQLNLPDAVTQLLDKGADKEGGNAEGARPLHTAAQWSPAAVAILLKKGAEKMSKDSKGRTPLHYAAKGNNAQSIQLLIDAGGDVNAQDNDGQTPLHLALQEKEAFDAIRALISHKADVHIPDKKGWGCSKLCMDETRVTLRVRTELFKAANVIDEREFAVQRDFPFRKYIEGKLIGGWQKNPQFSFWSANQQNPTNALRIMMAFDSDDGDSLLSEKMSKSGFLVIGSLQNVHKEPSYQTGVEYGTIEPTSIILRQNQAVEVDAADKKTSPEWKPYHTLIPYGKMENTSGRFKIVIYSQEEIEVKEVSEWRFKATVSGEWTANSAGGCKQYQDTWSNNPRFKLKLPPGRDKFEFCLMLSQQKSGMDLVPYQVIPYQFFIGYYILEDLDIVFENKNWKNALDVWDIVTIDTTRQSEVTVIPTTFKQGQLTGFTLTAFADEEIKFGI